jgi:hypothetical protein
MTDQMSNNTSVSESQPQFTPEEEKEVQKQIGLIKSAVDAFLADPRHERYRQGPENRKAIGDYLDEHKLEYTPDSLHDAFIELSKAGKLNLYAESRLPTEPESVQKLNTKKENLVDLSFGLVDQQKGRRQPLTGPRSVRDAFINAGQNEPPVQIKGKGTRLHL